MGELLFSIEGFNLIFDSILSGRSSKTDLQNLLNATEDQVPLEKGDTKKAVQHSTIAQLIKHLGIQGEMAIDYCCGKGLAREYLSGCFNNVLGIDTNEALILRNREQSGESTFRVGDITQDLDLPENDLAFGLHCCGDLTDRVLQFGVLYSGTILVVPCCYSKISRRRPLSSTLAKYGEKLRIALDQASRSQSAHPSPKNFQFFTGQIWRRLVDLDRFFYLKEQGYSPQILKLQRTDKDSAHAGPMDVVIYAKSTCSQAI
jgi:hypothetical protein